MIASRRTLARICVALILIGPLLRVLLYLNGVDGDKIHRITTSHLDVLSLGALAALIVRDENWVRRLTPRLSYFAYPCLITFCVLGVVPRSFSYDRVAFIYGNLPLGIFFAALLLRAVTTSNLRSRLQRFLQAEWLRSFGKYSYAIYVLHWPLARLYFDTILPHLTRKLRGTPLRSWFLHPGIFGGVTLIILFIIHIVAPCLFFFGLGKFSWWAFEGPINGLKRYFNPRWRSSIPKPVET
jgi:peptidoglycan/LPS O-acetylase OafA/YrhL